MKRSGLKTKRRTDHGTADHNAARDNHATGYDYATRDHNATRDNHATGYDYATGYHHATRDDNAAHDDNAARDHNATGYDRADYSCCGGRAARDHHATGDYHAARYRDQRGRLRDEGDDRHGDREGR